MRHNFLILILINLLIMGCGETSNEYNINRIFIDEGTEGNSYRNEYNTFVSSTNMYREDFTNSNNSIWYKAYISDGNYILYCPDGNPVYFGHVTLQECNPKIDINKDYQIEIYLHSQFKDGGFTQGIIFNDNRGYSGYCYSVTNHIRIGFYSGKIFDDWYSSNLPTGDAASWHLYTIRKIGDEVYFYLDKKFIYKTTFCPISNFGFMTGVGGILTVDWISADYITKK